MNITISEKDGFTIFLVSLALCLSAITVFLIHELQSMEAPIASPVADDSIRFHHAFLAWTAATTSASWSPRDSAASFVFNDRMWTMGGLNGNAVTGSDHAVQYWDAVHYNDIWSSSDGRTWTREREHADWSPRRSMTVVPFQGELWMLGGWSPITGYSNEIWKSSDAISWQKVVAKAPWAAREGQSVEVFDGKMWLLGGVNYDERTVFHDVWSSSDGLAWTMETAAAPWSGRWDHATTQFQGRIFLTGGMDLTKQSFSDVWVSENGADWELIENNPPWQSRQGHSLMVVHGALWLVSRLNDVESGGSNDVWYSLDGLQWQKTVADPPWLGREAHAGLVFRDRMFIFGGMDAAWEWRNDVWHSN